MWESIGRPIRFLGTSPMVSIKSNAEIDVFMDALNRRISMKMVPI
jgi:hypothetical protein